MPSVERGMGPVAPGNRTGQLFQQQQRARQAQIKRERAVAERQAAEAEQYLDSLTQNGELTPIFSPVDQSIVCYLDRDGNEVPA